MKVLVTGAAGFIGSQVCSRLTATKDCDVLGVDNLNDYYSVDLKRARLAPLTDRDSFRFIQADFSDAKAFAGIYRHFKPDYVVHLGAQAGVRYSIENPAVYTQSNLIGFANVLETCRQDPPKHLVFASSSSVYGAATKPPFREDANTDQPISFYGATKKANEAMAHSYAHLYGLMVTGLRFFTVYGPWGRPDMAPTIFAKAICAGEPLKLFNSGQNLRDFTYIDDIVEGVLRVLLYPPDPRPVPPYRIFNIGHNRPVETLRFVQMLEQLLERPAQIELVPPQPGDMPETCACLDQIHAAVGYTPKIALDEGLQKFTDWFKSYYRSLL